MEFESVVLTDFDDPEWEDFDISNIYHVLSRIEEDANQHLVFGEPYDSTLTPDINLKRVSHQITEVCYSNKANCIFGTVKFLDTPNGNHISGMLDAGLLLSDFKFRMRAFQVQNGYKKEINSVITWDIESKPNISKPNSLLI